MKFIKNKRGQSTVEYVLLVTAVLAVIITFVGTKTGGFQSQMNTTLNTVTGDIGTLGSVLSGSHQPLTVASPDNGEQSTYVVNPTK